MNCKDTGEVSLKSVLLLLWSEKKILLIITTLFLSISCFYVFFIQKDEYETSSKVLLNLPEVTTEMYGTYKFISTEPSAYINALGNYYKGKVRVEIIKGEKYISVTAVSDSPDKAIKLSREAADKYIETLRIQSKINAVDVFLKTLEVQNIQYKERIAFNGSLIDGMRQINASKKSGSQRDNQYVGDVKFSMDTDEVAFTESLTNSDEYIDAKITILETNNSDLSKKVEYNNKYINELKKEQETIASKLGKENEMELLNGKADVMNPYISNLTDANQIVKLNGFGSGVIVLIGLLSGLLVGSFVVLFKDYWKTV